MLLNLRSLKSNLRQKCNFDVDGNALKWHIILILIVTGDSLMNSHWLCSNCNEKFIKYDDIACNSYEFLKNIIHCIFNAKCTIISAIIQQWTKSSL